jgi:hypothetical protein
MQKHANYRSKSSKHSGTKGRDGQSRGSSRKSQKSSKSPSSSISTKAADMTLKVIDDTCRLFVLGKMKTMLVPKRSRFNIFRSLYMFLLMFNFLYFGNSFITSISFVSSYDFQLIFFNRATLFLVFFFFVFRMFQSAYGVFAVTCAVNRMPLYMLMLYTTGTCFLFSMIGSFVIVTNYLPLRFHEAIRTNAANWNDLDDYTWSWVDRTQRMSECCGFDSYRDYSKLAPVANETDSTILPLSCCKNEKAFCMSSNANLHLNSCEPMVHDQQRVYVVAPLTMLMLIDVMTIALSLYMMRTFRYHLQREQLPEDEPTYLLREENRLVGALIRSQFIAPNEVLTVADQFRHLIRVEKTRGLRGTMEGVAVAIRRLTADRTLLVTQVRPEQTFNVTRPNDTIKPIRDTAIVDLITNQMNVEMNRRLTASAAAKLKTEDTAIADQLTSALTASKTPSNVQDQLSTAISETKAPSFVLNVSSEPSKTRADSKQPQDGSPVQVLFDSGRFHPVSPLEAEEVPKLPQMTRVKSDMVLHVQGGVMTPKEECHLPESIRQAPRTRSANFEIAKRLQAMKELRDLGEKVEFGRTNSTDLRLDKMYIGNMIKSLAQRSVNLPLEARK